MESKLGYSALRDGYSPTGDEDDDDDTPGALSEAPGTATSRLRLLSSTSSGSVGEGACCSRTSSSGVAPCGMNRRARNEETNATSMALAVSLVSPPRPHPNGAVESLLALQGPNYRQPSSVGNSCSSSVSGNASASHLSDRRRKRQAVSDSAMERYKLLVSPHKASESRTASRRAASRRAASRRAAGRRAAGH